MRHLSIRMSLSLLAATMTAPACAADSSGGDGPETTDSTGSEGDTTWACDPPTCVDPDVPMSRALEPQLLFRLRPPMPQEAQLGQHVLVMGDMNGDGLSEIVVDDTRTDQPGDAYVIFGKHDMREVSLDAVAGGQGGFLIRGESGTTTLPWSMADAGDVNGDGLADLVLGNVNVDVNGDNAGAAYVVFGKGEGDPRDLDTVVSGVGGLVIRGAQANDDVGEWVAGGTDVDLDGYDDVFVGAPNAHFDGEAHGAAYVVFGGSDGSPVELADIDGSGRGFTIRGHAWGAAGTGLDMPGDLDGDGWPDLVVGAPEESAVAQKSGRAYVIFGGPQLGTMALADVLSGDVRGFVIESTGWFESAGIQTRGLGDVNGDGAPDIYVTSGEWGHVVFGKADSETVYLDDLGAQGFRVLRDPYLRTGVAAAPMGDVDGDGLADFVLGGPIGSPLILVLGKPDASTMSSAGVREGKIGGAVIEAQGGAFGWGFDGGGDVDGDGWPDLVVGQPHWFEEPSWGYVYGF